MGVWFTDINGRVILSNPKAREIWSGSAVSGVSEEGSHRWWEDAPNRSESHCRALRRALTNGENTLDETTTIVCADGTEKTIHHFNRSCRAEDGAILGAIVVNEDVTDRTRLEEQAQLFRTLMDHSSDAVFMCDPTTGQFLDVNASACRHLRYSREELLGLGVPDIEDIPADKDAWAHLITGLKRTGSRTLTGGHRRRDGSTFPVEVNAGFVSLGRGDFIVAVARDISDRKRVEEQLRRSEERFRSLIQYSSDIITILNPDGTIRYESPAFYRLFGYREEKILGRSAFEFVHPDDLDRTMQIFREKLHVPGLAEPVVFKFRKADGGYLTLEVVGNNLLHDPNIQGIVVNCRDVTERIRAEEALRASEAKLRALADHAPVSIFMADLHGNCAYVNRRWCDMTGYSPDQAYGRGWLHTLPPDDRQHLNETRLGEHLAVLSPVELEFRFVTRTGMIRWAEGSTIPLQNAQHEVTGYISTSTDITERRRAEEELRRSHAFVRQIIDTDPNFIFAKDREGRFTLVNQAIADCYGTTVDELIGRTDADFNPNREEVALFRKHDLEVMDTLTDRFIPEEIITDSAGNRRWLQTVKRPLLDEHGRAIQLVGAASDITARKQVEEALRQREHDLQAALQEREHISQELHDGILQSLYAVGLGLETCKSMLRRNPRKAARTLERAVTQLNALMREVRNFIAGLESELLQGGDLAEALRTVVQSIAIPHGLPFRIAIDRKAARHLTREQGVHVLNIVREAVSNSLRHAKASGGHVSLRRLKHSVRVTIRDNGVGFTPDRVVGLGHGLQNMAARAKRIGGRLTIDSQPKRGTRILFDLPKERSHGSA